MLALVQVPDVRIARVGGDVPAPVTGAAQPHDLFVLPGPAAVDQFVDEFLEFDVGIALQTPDRRLRYTARYQGTSVVVQGQGLRDGLKREGIRGRGHLGSPVSYLPIPMARGAFAVETGKKT